LRGKTIREVELRAVRLRSPVPNGLTALLRHSEVTGVGRKGKYLLIRLDRGTWLVHLGMSGRFLLGAPETTKDEKHDHLILRTSCGLTVRYNDFRRFGTFAICPSEATHPLLSRLGIDAISNDLNGDVLLASLLKRNTPIKAALLNQRLIAGLGNIYACESLYWADIHPKRPSSSLTPREAHKLSVAIHNVLITAIEAGGATLPDYAHTSGALGNFHRSFAVFQRHGSRCPRCDRACVQKTTIAGRTTYHCATHQM